MRTPTPAEEFEAGQLQWQGTGEASMAGEPAPLRSARVLEYLQVLKSRRPSTCLLHALVDSLKVRAWVGGEWWCVVVGGWVSSLMVVVLSGWVAVVGAGVGWGRRDTAVVEPSEAGYDFQDRLLVDGQQTPSAE